MKTNPSNSRRSFLGQLGLMAFLPSIARRRALEPNAEPSPWDMQWVDRVAKAPYKAVIDSTTIAEGNALNLAADIMDRFHDVYNGPDDQTRVVIVVRQMGTPLAFQDALWDRYAIGEDQKINDAATKAPARRNPFLRGSSNEPARGDKIEPLVARGLTILVCNRSAMNWARSFAEKTKRDVEEVRTEFRNGLVPGAVLMPDGIFALVRAQNAVCALMKA